MANEIREAPGRVHHKRRLQQMGQGIRRPRHHERDTRPRSAPLEGVPDSRAILQDERKGGIVQRGLAGIGEGYFP